MKLHSLQSIQIIGHRGSAAPFPDNTLEAIMFGILSGARMIEIDLRLSKDKEVVLAHDENLSKTTGISRNISDKTWEELSQLQIKKNKETFHIARLNDVFKSVPDDIQFYLEIKTLKSSHSSAWDRKLVDKVISLIKKEKFKKQCLIMSFDQDIVCYAKRKYPSHCAGIILNSNTKLNTLIKDTRIKFDCLAVNYKLLTKRNLQIIRNSGIPFIVWTVNSKRLWEKIASYRPLGIVTDYPEKFTGVNHKL